MKKYAKNINKLLLILPQSLLLIILLGCSTGYNIYYNTITYDGLANIGIIQLVEHPALDDSREGFISGIKSRGINVKIHYYNAQGDNSTLSTIAQRFVNNNMDLIHAIATNAVATVAAETETIPIVAGSITDFITPNFAISNEEPGFNITGTSALMPVYRNIDMILEFMPQVETIGILFTSSEPNSVYHTQLAKAASEERGLTVELGSITNVNELQQVANFISERVDVIYIPTDNTIANAFGVVVGVSQETHIPIFTADTSLTLQGGVATLSIDWYTLGRMAGYMAADILLGIQEPATTPIYFPTTFEYTVNATIAEEFGLTIPKRLADFVVFP